MTGRAIRWVTGLGCETDEGGDRGICLALEARDHGAEGRRIGLRTGGAVAIGGVRRATGVADEGIVRAGERSVHAADGHQFVHHFGEHRCMLGNLDAGDVGLDRLVGAADLQRGVHFQVPHVLMRGSPAHVDHDDRLEAAASASFCLRLEEFRQGKSTHRQAANAQEIAPRQTVAELPVGFAGDREHSIL